MAIPAKCGADVERSIDGWRRRREGSQLKHWQERSTLNSPFDARSAERNRGLDRMVAGNEVTLAHRAELRLLLRADIGGVGTPRMEPAAGWRGNG